MADNKKMVKFGRGTKSMEEFQGVTGYENMIYFNTTEHEIYVGAQKYGFSNDDRALLDSAIVNIEYAYDSESKQGKFTATLVDGSTKVLAGIPIATESNGPGLMTQDHVTILVDAAERALKLDGNGEGSVKKAQADAEAYAKGLVDSVLSEDVDASGAAIVKISQVEDENGNKKIVAEAGDVEAAHVSVATDKIDADNVEGALIKLANDIADLDAPSVVDQKIQAAIGKLDNDPSAAKGSNDFFSVSVTQVDGKVTGVTITDDTTNKIASVASVSAISGLVGEGFNNSDKTVAKEVARVEALVSTLETSKVNVNAAAIEQEKKDRAQAITNAVAELEGTFSDGDAKTLAAINDRIDTVSEVANNISYSIKKVTEGLGSNVKEAYQLINKLGAAQGDVINIYKDSALKSVELTDKNAEEVAGQFLKFTYLTVDGGEDVVYVNVSAFLVENEFKDGLKVLPTGEVSVKIADASESFLTVDGNGVKLSGVQNAIDSAKTAAKNEIVNGASEGYQTLKDVEDKVKAAASSAAEHTTVKAGNDNELVKVENTKTEGGLEYTITATNIAKASDLTTLTNKVNNEVIPAISTAEKNAKDHADDEVKKLRDGEVAANTAAISKETEDRIKGDTDTLNSANAYTDAALSWYED